MRKVVKAMIVSMTITFLSILIVFFLQAPLISLVYYGCLTETPAAIACLITSGTACTKTFGLVAVGIQILLTFVFLFAMFKFICKLIASFFPGEKTLRYYYRVFFFIVIFVPVFLTFVSVLFKIKLVLFIVIIELIFNILLLIIILLTKKILPDTQSLQFRRYLFTKGDVNDN